MIATVSSDEAWFFLLTQQMKNCLLVYDFELALLMVFTVEFVTVASDIFEWFVGIWGKDGHQKDRPWMVKKWLLCIHVDR